MALDPFTTQIIRNFLFSTTEEMIQTTVLTAYSPTFSEGFDFSCALFDRDGRMVIQSRGIGVHLGSLVQAMRAVVAKFPTPEPGDVFITNNPYLATHQSDVMVCRPMFLDGAHLGFAVNIGHWTDIGGMSPGGCAGTSTHVVQDGLIIPLSRLYRGGELVEETRDFILANVRLPEDDWGDLMSQISATAVAENRLRELVGRYGIDDVLAGMAAAIDYSRDRFLARMRDVPDGVYEAEDFIEDDGLTDARYPIRVKVTKNASHFRVDFAGTAAAAPTPINAALSSARAAVYTAIIALVDPLTPVNAGIFDLIELDAPEGSIVNALWPRPVYGCTFEMAKRVPETILKAFGKTLPAQVAAGSHASGNNLAGRSKNPKTGEDVVWYNYYEGGQGATAHAPGNDAVYFWGETSHNQPIEVWEHKYQVLVERYGLRDGSGGAGRHRGGMGTVHEYRLLEDHHLSGLGDRHRIAPWGLAGGEDGAPNRWSLRRNGETRELGDVFGLKSPSKFYNIPLLKGDVLIIETGGGGGYGRSA
ncbi:hydantoinase B/oxoprolinase family protein [Lichenifustis flavocetrariae]|uniref:Hydantoinase B/oxoprolinase family protein n=1 Tax=Lichenifustis flavocetrariae TaxID=2949735 RepID=A0AA41YXZ9_9HYPH|nr:hydantoinase B/oxoprolinase family protein [Lichenifustis flavocetrariae]MCW6509277.1 hydantoinase B/oxoprolinase family protein [Lichenifustis flavocetrariae]